jgi:hypothetical protein
MENAGLLPVGRAGNGRPIDLPKGAGLSDFYRLAVGKLAGRAGMRARSEKKNPISESEMGFLWAH